MRLADMLDLEQEEIAMRMGVSRKTVWKDLHSARRKVTDAIVNGKALRIAGCETAGCGVCGFQEGTDDCGHGRCRRGEPEADTDEE